ncbi:MAG: VanW family protein [Lachnospiraceae bacterium]|nr:VanW family protein [Lachnospiraceae bacterium]
MGKERGKEARKRKIKHKSTSRKLEMKRRKRRLLVLKLTALGAALAAIVITAAMYRYVSRYSEKEVGPNIYIGSVNVSGMNQKEVKEALKKHLTEDQQEKVTLKVEDQSVETSWGELGLKYKDLDKQVQHAVEYGSKGSLWSRFWKIRKLEKEKKVLEEVLELDDKMAKAVIKEQAIPLSTHAVDAALTKKGETLEIQPEKTGRTIDIKKSISQMESYLNNEWTHEKSSVELVLKEELPKVMAKDLKDVKDELGSFSTDAGGGQRWQNLKNGVDRLNGTVLMPGEEISVYQETGPYDAEHGYVEAGSYENGQVVDSFGGGICQVSTTLYNAVLLAELEVVERHPHSMLVNYVEPSRDAAIATGLLDFRFQNNYDAPVCILAEIDAANQMKFVIYGKDTREKGRTIKFESETLTTAEAGIAYQENPQAPLGSMKYSGSPHTGKTAQLWKVIYKDGQEVSREVINQSTYARSDQVVEVGTASENAVASALVREALVTQDQAKIAAAITQAQAMGSQSAGGASNQNQEDASGAAATGSAQ